MPVLEPPPRGAGRSLPLPATDLEQLRTRVRALAENRPAVYQMVDATGKVLYVGKAKRLRNPPAGLFSRELSATTRPAGSCTPPTTSGGITCRASSRPISPSCGRSGSIGPTSTIAATSRAGPFSSKSRAARRPGCIAAAVSRPTTSVATARFARWPAPPTPSARSTISSASATAPPRCPLRFAGQGDLFRSPAQAAACMRHELGWCSGPCAGFVTERDYLRRVDTRRPFSRAARSSPSTESAIRN